MYYICISIFEVLSTILPTFDHLYKELRVNWSLPWSSLLNKQTSKQMTSSSDPSLSSSNWAQRLSATKRCNGPTVGALVYGQTAHWRSIIWTLMFQGVKMLWDTCLVFIPGACNVNGSIQFKGNEKLKMRLHNILSTPGQMSETYRTSDM